MINKHTNPAVFAARTDQLEALLAALATDKKSPSGGILCCSGRLTEADHRFPGEEEPRRALRLGCPRGAGL